VSALQQRSPCLCCRQGGVSRGRPSHRSNHGPAKQQGGLFKSTKVAHRGRGEPFKSTNTEPSEAAQQLVGYRQETKRMPLTCEALGVGVLLWLQGVMVALKLPLGGWLSDAVADAVSLLVALLEGVCSEVPKETQIRR